MIMCLSLEKSAGILRLSLREEDYQYTNVIFSVYSNTID